LHCLWDHPRTRGEHGLIRAITALRQGSSPHARGAQCEYRQALNGIIPARAGSTRPGSGTAESGRDHPRTRGEHV